MIKQTSIFQKLTFAILCGLLAAALLTGCGENNGTESSTQSGSGSVTTSSVSSAESGSTETVSSGSEQESSEEAVTPVLSA